MEVQNIGGPTDQVRIIFIDGSWFDFVKPAGFVFPDFITAMRSNGMVLSNNAYVRADLVKCAFEFRSGGDLPFTVGAAPNAPSSGTKQ